MRCPKVKSTKFALYKLEAKAGMRRLRSCQAEDSRLQPRLWTDIDFTERPHGPRYS